ncbi:MAG: 16S rRNA (cytosine(1402)-N(4))-methyltransferase RsmH [Actinomycetota bacterium]|nr:16S rRNA (cytosine(1402)-N(4))-methyltransferase RsmH [Actinomycetota bacterium]
MSRVSDEFAHQPVMVHEIVDLVAPVPPGVVLDATVGGGGHAAAILAAHPHLSVVGVDQDPAAVAAAVARLAPFGPRARLIRARFDHLDAVLADLGVGALSGALFDLGVSSPQLDRAGRGFSYRAEGPLDMRMDPDATRSAADVVNASTRDELAALFAANGEGRFARRIAGAVVAARPITTTTQFAEVVRDAIPAATRRHGGHPARRVFQAVRIAVNEELDVLPAALGAALERLVGRGRLLVLAYHSGEDRIVKVAFRQAETGGCVCPSGLPCVCGAQRSVRLVRRGALKPGAEEVAGNRRAESARLRVAERLADGPGHDGPGHGGKP